MNFVVKNYIVSNGQQELEDKDTFFKNQDVEFIPVNWTMHRLIVHAGFFQSIEEVKKEWVGPEQIPLGLRNFYIGAKGKIKVLRCPIIPEKLRS